MASIIAATSARRETSHVSARKPESPRDSKAATPSATDASFDPQRKTFAPSRRKRSTISSPVFRQPPVTTATLPSKRFMSLP